MEGHVSKGRMVTYVKYSWEYERYIYTLRKTGILQRILIRKRYERLFERPLEVAPITTMLGESRC